MVELGPGLVLTEGSGLLQGLVNLISINFLKKGLLADTSTMTLLKLVQKQDVYTPTHCCNRSV